MAEGDHYQGNSEAQGDYTPKTFFVKYNEDVQKVNSFTGSLDDLTRILVERFGDIAKSFTYWMEDRTYGVTHRIETATDIHDGAVVDARIPPQAEKKDLKRELEEVKRKLKAMESGGSKRQRVGSPPATQRSTRFDAKDDGKYVVRLRGLPWSASVGDITKFFEGINVRGGDEGVFLCINALGRATGEAFVQFESADAFEDALARDHNSIGRRYIEVYRSNEEEKQRAENLARSSRSSVKLTGPVSQTSFVIRLRGIPFTSTEDEIRKFFAGVDIVAVHIIYEPTGRASGEAYIELATDELMRQAMSFHKKNIGSRYVELFRSNVEELSIAIRASQGSSHPESRGGRGGRGGYRERDRGWDRDSRGGWDRDSRDRGRDEYSSPGSETSPVLKMLGIPFSATEGDLTRFFQEANVIPIRIHRKQNGGEAFIEFGNSSDAARAMSLNKKHIGRRYIDLFRVTYQEMASIVGLSPVPPPPTNSGGGFQDGPGMGGGMGGGFGGGGFGGHGVGTPYGGGGGGYGPTGGGGGAYGPTGGGPSAYGQGGGPGAYGPPGGYQSGGGVGGYGTNTYGGGPSNNYGGPRGPY